MIGPRRQREWRGRRAENVQPFISLALQSAGLVVSLNTLKPRCWSLPFPKLCIGKDGKGPSDDWTASATRLVTSQSRECPTVHKSSVADRKFGCITQYIEKPRCWSLPFPKLCIGKDGKGPSDDWTASATRLVTSQSRECPTVHKSSVADRKFGCITQYIEKSRFWSLPFPKLCVGKDGKGPSDDWAASATRLVSSQSRECPTVHKSSVADSIWLYLSIHRKTRCWSLTFPKLCVGKDGKGPCDDWAASATRLVTSQSRECPTVHKSSVADSKFGCITQSIHNHVAGAFLSLNCVSARTGKGPAMIGPRRQRVWWGNRAENVQVFISLALQTASLVVSLNPLITTLLEPSFPYIVCRQGRERAQR